jgi:adenylate cyclase
MTRWRFPTLWRNFPADQEEAFLAEYAENSVVILRIAIPLAIILYLLFFIWDYMHDPATIPEKIGIRISFIMFAFCTFFLTYFPIFLRHMQSIMFVFLCAAATGVAFVLLYTTNGFNIGIAGVLLAIMYGCGFARLLFWTAASFTVTTVAISNLVMVVSEQDIITIINADFFLVSSSIIAVTYAYFLELGERRAYYYKYQFLNEKVKVDSILQRFIPVRMLAQLDERFSHVAEAHGEATVVFADLVGFTNLSKRLSPSHLLEILSDIFTKLDELAERHNVDTIKTIGDAYMAAAVVDLHGSNTAERVADFAIAALDSVQAYATAKDLPIRMRVGMATGSVVSGIIGKKKPIFDLWGETVNEASRLETEGIEGEILSSEPTYWRLRNSFNFEESGDVRINADLSIRAYKLKSRK